MDPTLEWWTLNVAYVLYVVAAFPKRLIPLRVVLITASLAFIVYGAVADIWSVILWNIAFGGVQLVQLIRLMLEARNLHLDPELEHVHQRLFATLSQRDFFYLWSIGEERICIDETLAVHGEENHTLYLVLDGELHVMRGGATVFSAGPMRVLGEVSLLTGDPATADIVATDEARIRIWPHEKLRALQTLRPEVYSSMITTLSRELSNKIDTSSHAN